MKNNRLRKKDKVVSILIFVAIVVVLLVARFLPGVVRYWQSSEVYKRYCDVEGVRATYIQDFRVNDTLTVGVTLLKATDSAGWGRLIKDFGIVPYSDTILSLINSNSVQTKYIPKGNPLLPMDSILTNNDFMVVSQHKWEISLFDIKTDEQIEAIFQYQFTKLKNSNED